MICLHISNHIQRIFLKKIRKFMVKFLKNSIQCVDISIMLVPVSLLPVISEF